MARPKEAPYYLRSKAGWAYIDFRTPEGRRKHYLKIPYDPERSGSEERRAAEQAAEDAWRRLTGERVLDDSDSRVKTTLSLVELYALYLRQWAIPHNASPSESQHLMKVLANRRSYGRSLFDWAADSAKRADGTPRWKDAKTPLQRVVEDGAPAAFLAWRLLTVKRKTMRKEKSNLFGFLTWAKTQGFLASIPSVELPVGKGVPSPLMANSGWGYHIPLTVVEAAKLVAVMPEWSSRVGRKDGAPFLVRPFFEFVQLTGLREATVERLEVPRNWSPGRKSLRIEKSDDKAEYERELPLLPGALAILEKYAPKHGLIFGSHDFRKHVKRAAVIVFADDPEKARRFGAYHFRHHVATYLANHVGTNLPAAQLLLGHTELKTTSGYVHPKFEDARELLTKVSREVGRAKVTAEKWARKQARSVPIRPPKPASDS